jgi:virginiamycin A acetyltransferase
MLRVLRKYAWKFLGINFYNFLKNTNSVNLKEVNWVSIGRHSYDNGAHVWRCNTNSTLVLVISVP